MAEKVKTVALTFDVDYTDYYSGGQYDEMSLSFPEIKTVLTDFPEIKTTWFIRIDNQIESIFGHADHIFLKHQAEIEWLLSNGHEIGWHHHSYRQNNNNWEQETDEIKVSDHIEKYGEIASKLKYNIKAARMGWGFHTNKTMKTLTSLPFKIDSSAIPRPVYQWELSKKDWSVTPDTPYVPSQEDYRQPGKSSLSILEIPINTVELPLQTDTLPGIKRYINPAYYHSYFSEAVEDFKLNSLVAICHPYELIKKDHSSGILSFSILEFRKNLQYLREKKFIFKTIEGIGEEYLGR